MFHSASRLGRSQNRRLLGAALALLYLWGFVALGLTHTHASAPVAKCRHPSGVTLTAADTPVIAAALVPADDPPCGVCAVLYTTAVALARPPAAARALTLVRPLSPASTSSAPTRSVSTFRPRGPPQA